MGVVWNRAAGAPRSLRGGRAKRYKARREAHGSVREYAPRWTDDRQHGSSGAVCTEGQHRVGKCREPGEAHHLTAGSWTTHGKVGPNHERALDRCGERRGRSRASCTLQQAEGQREKQLQYDIFKALMKTLYKRGAQAKPEALRRARIPVQYSTTLDAMLTKLEPPALASIA